LLPWWRQQTIAREEAAQARAMATAEAAYPATVLPSGSPVPAAVAVVPPGGSVGGTQVIAIQNILPPSSPLAQEIRVAQSKFWRVYQDAAFSLDDSQLPEVAAGEALEFVTGRIAKFKADGIALEVWGDHTSTIFDTTDKKAFIHDKFKENYHILDAQTKKRISTHETVSGGPVPEYINIFERIDGVWKMTHLYSTTPLPS
jgi:hypothetical protein